MKETSYNSFDNVDRPICGYLLGLLFIDRKSAVVSTVATVANFSINVTK